MLRPSHAPLLCGSFSPTQSLQMCNQSVSSSLRVTNHPSSLTRFSASMKSLSAVSTVSSDRSHVNTTRLYCRSMDMSVSLEQIRILGHDHLGRGAEQACTCLCNDDLDVVTAINLDAECDTRSAAAHAIVEHGYTCNAAEEH